MKETRFILRKKGTSFICIKQKMKANLHIHTPKEDKGKQSVCDVAKAYGWKSFKKIDWILCA